LVSKAVRVRNTASPVEMANPGSKTVAAACLSDLYNYETKSGQAKIIHGGAY